VTSALGTAQGARSGVRHPLQVGLHHECHQLAERGLWRPPQLRLRLAGVADQQVDLGRAQEGRVDHDEVLPGEARRLEGGLHELAHAVRLAGREHVVAGFVALQHGVHAGHVLPGVAPVALGVQVAKPQLALLAVLDARHRQADLAGHELRPAQRALVVEQDARAGVQPERLAVVHGDPVPVHLRHPVGAARVEGRALVLRDLADLAEHLARRRLVEADARVHRADGLQNPRDADAGDVAGHDRLLERERHEALRRQVVHLIRLDPLQHPHDVARIRQIEVDELQRLRHTELVEPLAVAVAGAPLGAHHPVTLVQQQLCEVAAVLAGDARDQGRLRHRLPASSCTRCVAGHPCTRSRRF
jgi:hypothetical protein